MRLIDAERLKEVFERNTGYDYHDIIDIQPTIEERPHGKWIFEAVSPFSISWFRCSYCGYKNDDYKHYNFCPNCGASMVSVNSKICPCIECCKIDNSEPCRKGCSDYQKWKASEME